MNSLSYYSTNRSLPWESETLKNWAIQHIKDGKVKENEIIGRCTLPTHNGEDRNPSFAFNFMKGTGHCFACHAAGEGLSVKELAAAWGVEPPPMKPVDQTPPARRIVAEYPYIDADEILDYQAVRLVPKGFLYRRPDGKGGWFWDLKGKKPIPYRLPELLRALERGEPVFAVEGEKDVERLRGLGLTATTNHGGAGKWTDEHSKHFPAGAKVIILPDNDDPGRKHAQIVARLLHGRGCEVKIVELPDLPLKGDVSDWLDAGHTKDELLELVETATEWTPELVQEKVDDADPLEKIKRLIAPGGYSISKNGETTRRTMQRIGKESVEVEKPIMNGALWVTSETIRDDGEESSKKFTVAGRLAGGRNLPEAPVAADQFSGMNWVVKCWGLGPNIEPGQGNKDYLRHALQLTAQGVDSRTVFTHIGWREINGKWRYLHAGMPDVDVSEEGLARYHLLPPNPAMMKTAIELLDVGPREVTVPLMATVFLAPLCEPLRRAGIEPAFVLWVVGLTGAMKSTLAALFLSFFGQFDSRSLPGNFRDTANSLEKRAFACKDSLIVVDDFHPVSSDSEARRMQESAQKLLRAFGDRQGRARMNSDLSIRRAYVPRGMCLVTGEDLPDVGESGAARYFALDLKRGDIDKAKLTELQGRIGEFSSATAAYTEWMCSQFHKTAEGGRSEFEALRTEATRSGEHGRFAESVAWLQIGYSAFLRFAVESDAMTQEQADDETADCWRILNKLASEQAKRTSEERPAARFVRIFEDLQASRTVYCRHLSCVDSLQRDGQLVGWEDSDHYYLLPGEIYRQAAKFAQAQGGRFPISERRLWSHLATEGMIEVDATGGRTYNTLQRVIDGEKRRVLILRKDALHN